MERGWPGKISLILLKSAALMAVVLVGLNFRNIDIAQSPASVAKRAYSNLNKQIIETKDNIENKYPQAEGIQLKKYSWEYGGKKYSISQNLYSSIYDFYKAQPKSYTYFNELPEGWEEQYYGMFVIENAKDSFIGEILDSIVIEGKKNKLSEDQTAELVLAFVQSIPYDDQKAANILSRSGNETMDYPYEVLFDNSGVCSDKSFLATVLLRKLGYGTAIFVFDNENHMAVGIQCPKEYSNYDSGYCFAETTGTGNKIGIIPELNSEGGKAVGAEQLSYFDDKSAQSKTAKKLTEVKIFQQTQGREYRGIVGTIKTNNEISSLKKELASLSAELVELKSQIDQREKYLRDKKEVLDSYLKAGEIKKYNEQAPKYNSALSEYEDLIKSHNKKVKTFNEKVSRYNMLIKL